VRRLTEIAIKHLRILSSSPEFRPELTAIVEPLYKKQFVETTSWFLWRNTRGCKELKNEMFQYLQTQVRKLFLLPYSRLLTRKLFSMYRGIESDPKTQVITLPCPTWILTPGSIHGVWTVFKTNWARYRNRYYTRIRFVLLFNHQR
jgi:hypothetical protein